VVTAKLAIAAARVSGCNSVPAVHFGGGFFNRKMMLTLVNVQRRMQWQTMLSL